MLKIFCQLTCYAKTKQLDVHEPRIGPMVVTQFKDAVKDILEAAGGESVWKCKSTANFLNMTFLASIEAISIASMY